MNASVLSEEKGDPSYIQSVKTQLEESSGKGRARSGKVSWNPIINVFGLDFDAVESGMNIRPELCW